MPSKKKKKFIIIIPARMKSNRLPGKPLIKINGIPIIIPPICLLVVCFDLKKIDTPARSKRGVRNDIFIIKI